MKRAAVALSRLSLIVGSGVGLEGSFLLVGGVFLAVGAGFISPAGPYFVIGGLCVTVALALAIPRRG